MTLYYTTENGTLKGRASLGYADKGQAEKLCEEQNAKAEHLGIKTRYKIKECADEEISERERRV